MQSFLIGLGVGLLAGGALVYIKYAMLKASIGKVTTAADAVKTAVK